MEVSPWPYGINSSLYVLRFPLTLGLFLTPDLPTSTAVLNGRNSAHFVSGCSTSTLEHSYSGLQAILLSISVSERINTSNALPYLLNRTGPYRYSLTWTCRSLYGPTTNTGLSHRFVLGRLCILTCCFDQQRYQPVQLLKACHQRAGWRGGVLDRKDLLHDRRSVPYRPA